MNYNPQLMNPLIQQHQVYSQQNPSYDPFAKNNMIKNNILVQDQLNNYRSAYQPQNNVNPHPRIDQLKTIEKNGSKKYKNVIEELLQPIKVGKDKNNDINDTYNERNDEYRRNRDKKFSQEMLPTNLPYKTIIKDERYIPKKVVNSNDLIVHKVKRFEKSADKKNCDDDPNIINAKHAHLYDKRKTQETSITIEYKPDDEESHRRNFDNKLASTMNINYENATHNGLKEDQIMFFKKKQKENEKNARDQDKLLRQLEKDGIIQQGEIIDAEII